VDEGEHALRHARLHRRGDDGGRCDLAGSRVSGVGFHDDGASRREGRDGVGSEHGDGDGKIARSEHGDRSDRLHQAADIRLGKRLAVRFGGVDAGIHPGAFAHEGGEEPGLIDRAHPFRLAPGPGVPGFRRSPVEKCVTEGEGLVGDRFEEGRPLFRCCLSKGFEGIVRSLCREIDLFGRGLVEGWLERGAGGGIEGVKCRGSTRRLGVRDDVESVEFHGGSDGVRVTQGEWRVSSRPGSLPARRSRSWRRRADREGGCRER